MPEQSRVEAMNRKQIAEKYNVCTRTFKKWLRLLRDQVPEPAGNIYTPAQVKLIFELLGDPPK